MKAYIYKLDYSYCTNPGANQNYDWEMQIERAVRSVFRISNDPYEASIFILPACPATWLSSVNWDHKKSHTYEQYLIRTMHKAGDFYQRFPHRHIVPRMRCPTIPDLYDTDEVIDAKRRLTRRGLLSAQTNAYKILWTNKAFRYICFETSSLLQSNQIVVSPRAIHVPYYIPESERMSIPTRRKYPARIRFIGSLCCNRSRIVSKLNVSDVSLISHLGKSIEAFETKQYSDFLRDAQFMYMPAGDTPERKAIYQSIAKGTPVYFTHYITPPLQLDSWHSWALVDFSMSFINNVPQVTLSNQKRNVFLWHTKEFYEQFRRVIKGAITA